MVVAVVVFNVVVVIVFVVYAVPDGIKRDTMANIARGKQVNCLW